MIALAISLALGFIIGESVRNGRLAVLASVAVGLLASAAVLAEPFILGGAVLQVRFLFQAMLVESVSYSLLALIGCYFGRRSAVKSPRSQVSSRPQA